MNPHHLTQPPLLHKYSPHTRSMVAWSQPQALSTLQLP